MEICGVMFWLSFLFSFGIVDVVCRLYWRFLKEIFVRSEICMGDGGEQVALKGPKTELVIAHVEHRFNLFWVYYFWILSCLAVA